MNKYTAVVTLHMSRVWFQLSAANHAEAISNAAAEAKSMIETAEIALLVAHVPERLISTKLKVWKN